MGRVRWIDFSTDQDTVVVFAALAAVVIVLVVGAIGTAMARDDSGMHQFFAGGGGGGFRPTGAPAFAAPPLTIHREPRRRVARHQPHYTRFARRGHALPVAEATPTLSPASAAATPGQKPAVVSIYEDRTLRRGDAVMTTKGIRIFAGSKTFPFRPEDFRLMATFKKGNIPFRRALMELDRLPIPG